MRRLDIPAALLLALSPALSSFAATLKVPSVYPTIQSAIDAAGSGDLVQIAGGIYFEDLAINNKTNLRIRPKAGHTVVVDASGVWPLTILGNSNRIMVRDLVLQDGVGGVWIGGSSKNVKLERCRIEDVSGDGVHVATADGVTVRRCEILGVGGDGVSMSTSSSDVRILRTTISQPAGRGIYMLGNSNSAEQNVIESPQQAGIQVGDAVSPAHSCLLFQNMVRGTASNAIDLYPPATGCSVMENRINRAGGFAGIVLRTGSGGHILFKNKIVRPTGDGIQCLSDGNVMKRNKVRKAGDDGIELVSAEHNLLYKNKVSKSGDDGFRLKNAKWNTLKYNKAAASSGYGLDDAANPGDNTYIDNNFGTIAP